LTKDCLGHVISGCEDKKKFFDAFTMFVRHERWLEEEYTMKLMGRNDVLQEASRRARLRG